MNLTPFHIAVQVRDIEEARDFYASKLGFPEGKSDEYWIDFNMFGYQFVTHLNPHLGKEGGLESISNFGDGFGVPVPHFGAVMNFDEWEALVKKVRLFIDDFIVEPYLKFEGEAGEQGTIFFTDPTGNALEFKAFKNI
jgi:extradiol dioxygenase family protein